MMLTRRILTICSATVMVFPLFGGTAHAYLNPYDVLLSQELLLPTAARDSQSRVERQQEESAARRDREQTEIFIEQNPPEPETTLLPAQTQDNTTQEAAGDEDVNYEFRALLRSLERISDQQARTRAEEQIRAQAFLLLQEEGNVLQLHGGAPVLPGDGTGLAPTGAGTILSIMVLLSAIAWTVYQARRGSRFTRSGS